jgi:exonuclease VII small subunit
MSKLISEQVRKTEILISGLKNNKDVVKNWGIDESIINDLETEKISLNEANQELERIKTEAKEKSRTATKQMSDLQKKFVEVKKIIKRDAEPLAWSQFGVLDKR